MNEHEWPVYVKNLLKAELKRKGLTYEQLVKKLEERGIHESLNGVKTKLHRGTFSAVFFLQCLEAIGCKEVRID